MKVFKTMIVSVFGRALVVYFGGFKKAQNRLKVRAS